MSYYSAIYGLRIHLSHRVPGLSFSNLQSTSPDIQVDFGVMPSWLDREQPTKQLWFVRQNEQPGADPRLIVWRLRDYFHLRYADGTQFVVDKAGTRVWATWPTGTLTLEDTATYLLGPVMGFVLLLRGCVSLHACAVAVDGGAIALVGPAGSGKSTTAAAFAERGYAILAEDVVTLQDRGVEFLVQPGYPSIRLWPSSVEALYGAAATLPRLTPTWDKCYLDLTQEKYEFQQQPLPLAAIYLLGERQEDRAPTTSEIAATERLMSLVANTYATYLMDKTMRAREFEVLGRVLESVPIKRVTPHSDPARIGELCQTIIEDFRCIASQPMER